MNYFQSVDFNAGVIYSGIEKHVVSMLEEPGTLSYSSNYSIPCIQLVPKNCSSKAEEEIIDATIRAITEHFDAVYGKNFTLNIYAWQHVKQYCLLFYSITRKELHKEMTIADIEEALGYKIKIVNDR